MTLQGKDVQEKCDLYDYIVTALTKFMGQYTLSWTYRLEYLRYFALYSYRNC